MWLIAGLRLVLRACAKAVVAGVAALVLVCLFDGTMIEKLSVSAPDAVRITRAERWVSPSRQWLAPTTLAAGGDMVTRQSGGWTWQSLPDLHTLNTTPRNFTFHLPPTAPDASLRDLPLVLWYRIDLARSGIVGADLAQIYVPRIQDGGNFALYLGNRIIWQTPNRTLFNDYYKPVLIPLAEIAPRADIAGARYIYIRIATAANSGTAVSSVWLARSDDAFNTAYVLREFLQLGVLRWTWAGFWLLGILSLAVWLRQRGTTNSAIFGRFALFALFEPIYLLPMLGADFLHVSQLFLFWCWVCGSFPLLLAGEYFVAEILGGRQPWLERISWVVGLPLAAYMTMIIYFSRHYVSYINIAQDVVHPIIFPLIMINIYMIGGVIKYRRSEFAKILMINIFVGSFSYVHDFLNGYFLTGGEELFLSVMTSLFSLFIFASILFRSYMMMFDATARASEELKLALAAKEAELTATHRQLMRIQRDQTLASERQRMMREMHDGIGASLVSALRFIRHGAKDPSAVAQVLEECIDDLKLAIDSLEPVSHDLLGLLANLRFRLGSRLQGSGITLDWEVEDVPPLPWLDAQSGMHILRILQEILTNLLKHSGATEVRLCTFPDRHEDADGITIEVTDNGTPFHPDMAGAPIPARKGLGNILSRTRLLHGHCAWSRGDNRNIFILWVPLAGGRGSNPAASLYQSAPSLPARN